MAARQRRPLVVPEEAAHPLFERPLFKRLTRLDVYAQPSADVQRRSAVGGAISLTAVAVIGLLVAGEVYGYAAGTEAYHDHLAVDVGVAPRVPIALNITFPAMQCQDVSLDVMDATGNHQNNVHTDLYKSPVNGKGRLVFRGQYHSVPFTKNGHPVALDPVDDPSSPSYCGKCYIEPHGARYWVEKVTGSLQSHLDLDNDTARCCNHCAEVMAIYDKHHLMRPPEEEVEQCLHGLFMKNPGCNIRGTLHVQKVKGSFHFAPGTALDGMPMGAAAPHVHLFNPMAVLRFNPSHRILHLSFGDPDVHRVHKRGVVHPLDGTVYHHPPHGLSTAKYFIKVVPTTYQIGTGKAERSYEFSVTKHAKVYMDGLSSSTGIFFSYDFFPIKVVHKFRRDPFLHFLVKLSGLIGGLFVVTGMLDAAVLGVIAWRRRRTPLDTPDGL